LLQKCAVGRSQFGSSSVAALIATNPVEGPLALVTFDVLVLNGKDVCALSLVEPACEVGHPLVLQGL